MSLERKLCEEISRCENCRSRVLSPVIIDGRHFCSVLWFERWKWRKDEGGKMQDERK